MSKVSERKTRGKLATAVMLSVAALVLALVLPRVLSSRPRPRLSALPASLPRLLRRAARWTLNATLVGAIALFVVVVAGPRLAGAELRTVVSGSMEPAIERGSVVVAFPVSTEDLEVGDTILFHQPDNPERVVTHRITAIDRGPPLAIETGGDANNESDPWSLSGSEILGRVSFHLPKLGYLVENVNSFAGFLGFLVVPCALLLTLELRVWYRFVRWGSLGRAQ